MNGQWLIDMGVALLALGIEGKIEFWTPKGKWTIFLA
jgi:hypothetical protein